MNSSSSTNVILCVFDSPLFLSVTHYQRQAQGKKESRKEQQTRESWSTRSNMSRLDFSLLLLRLCYQNPSAQFQFPKMQRAVSNSSSQIPPNVDNPSSHVFINPKQSHPSMTFWGVLYSSSMPHTKRFDPFFLFCFSPSCSSGNAPA